MNLSKLIASDYYTVRGDAARSDRSVSRKAGEHVTGPYLPNPDRVVTGAGDDSAAVRRHGDRVDTVGVPAELTDLAPVVQSPNPDSFVLRAGDDAATARRDGHRTDPLRMPLEPTDLGSGVQVPGPYRIITC